MLRRKRDNGSRSCRPARGSALAALAWLALILGMTLPRGAYAWPPKWLSDLFSQAVPQVDIDRFDATDTNDGQTRVTVVLRNSGTGTY
jgi:hypothetical protein